MLEFQLPDYFNVSVFVIAVLIITQIIVSFIRRKLDILIIYSERSVIHNKKWIDLLIYFIFFVIILIVAFTLESVEIMLVVAICGLIIFNLYEGFMEYKFDPKTREFIPKFIWAVSFAIIFVGSLIFLPPSISFADYVDDINTLQDNIEKIHITYRDKSEGTWLDTNIDDKQFFDEVVQALSNMNIQRTLSQADTGFDYMLIFHFADHSWEGFRSLSIEIFDEHLMFNHNGKYYKILNDNAIYELLDEYEFDWESYD